MKRSIVGQMLISVFILGVMAFHLEAATIYVDGNISPANCTTYTIATRACGAGSLTAYKTPTGVHAVLVPGDTVLCRGGTYTDAFHSVSPMKSGNSGQPITFAAYPGESCIWDNEIYELTGTTPVPGASGCQGTLTCYTANATHDVIFDGIIFDTQVRLGFGTHHIQLLNVEVRNSPDHGIVWGDTNTIDCTGSAGGCGVAGAHHITIRNCHIHNNGGGGDGGLDNAIYMIGSDNLVEGCHIHDTLGSGIQLWTENVGLTGLNNNVLRNNYIHDMNAFSSADWAHGVIVGQGANNQIYNNVIVRVHSGSGHVGAGSAIECRSGASNCQIYNNSIGEMASNDAAAIRFESSSGNFVRNNLLFSNAYSPMIEMAPGGAATFSNNICNSSTANCTTGTATFQGGGSGAGAQQYKPTSASTTTVDQGTSTGVSGIVTTDFNGLSRPQNGVWDIGAFEFAAAGDVTPPSIPTALGLTVISHTRIDLSWTASTDDTAVTGYDIYRCSGAACTPAFLVTQAGTGTTFQSTGLTPSTLYRYQVLARDAAGNTSGLSTPIQQATTNAAPAAALVAKYDFEAGSGQPQDTSGNALHATSSPGTNYITGKHGIFALHCNGTTGLVTINDATLLDLSTGFSLMAWVRPTITMTAAYRQLLAKDNLEVYYLYASHGDASGFPAGGYYDGTAYHEVTPVSPVLPVNTWSHWAVTWDGTTLINYRNGTSEATVGATGTIPNATGALTLCAKPNGTQLFEGDLDDVRIYDGAVTPAVLAAIIAEAAGDTMPPAAPANLQVVP